MRARRVVFGVLAVAVTAAIVLLLAFDGEGGGGAPAGARESSPSEVAERRPARPRTRAAPGEAHAGARPGAAGTLEVRVLGPDGSPLEGAEVRIGRQGEDLRRAGTTDADGRVVVTGLSDDSWYELQAAAGELALPRTRFVSREVRRTEVRLERVPAFRMRLVDAAGDAVEDSRVRVLWKGPQGFAVVATGTADAAGALTIRFQPVPGASYLLYVAHDDAPRRPDRIRLSSLPWTPRDGDVVVEREHLIRGVVRSASGATLPGAIVQYRRRPDLTEFTGADSAGVFTIGDSCAGRLGRFDEAELRAVLTGAEDRDVPWSHVRARTIDAVLVLDPGPYVVVRLPGPEAGETSSLPLETVPPLGGEATLLPGNAITLAGLDSAARYSVFVGPDERGRVAAVRDVSGATAGSEVELTWTQGLRTRGRALIGDRPWSGEIQARTRDKRRRVVATTRSDETGAFEFPGLPPGRWNLYTPDALPWADMDADAGCEDVTLVLDQHRNLRSGK